eukprot:4745635-Heterocapsa_arctica.AAC.1
MVLANISLFLLLRSFLVSAPSQSMLPNSSRELSSSIFESAMEPSLGRVSSFVPDQIWTEMAAA